MRYDIIAENMHKTQCHPSPFSFASRVVKMISDDDYTIVVIIMSFVARLNLLVILIGI